MPQTSISAWLNKPQSILEAPPTTIELPPAPTSNPEPRSYQPTSQSLSKPISQSTTTDVIMPDAEPPRSPPPPKLSLSLTNPIFHPLPPLPPNVEFVPATPALMPSFRRLNALLLPIPYSPRFYSEILSSPTISHLTLLALWHPVPLPRDSPTTTSIGRDTAAPLPKQVPQNQAVLVGAVRCRLLDPPEGAPEDTPPALYLSTIVCLSTHRSHGIATHLLREVIRRAVREHGVREVVAHVWEANEEGLGWYARRGFEVVGREEGYYRRLRPGTAVLVRKVVGVGDLIGDDTVRE